MPVGQPSGGSIRRPSSRVSRISSEGWGKRQRGKEDEGEEGGKDGGEDGGGEKRSEKKNHRSGKGVTGKESERRERERGKEAEGGKRVREEKKRIGGEGGVGRWRKGDC